VHYWQPTFITEGAANSGQCNNSNGSITTCAATCVSPLIEWLDRRLRIQEVPLSNLGTDTVNLLSKILVVFQENVRTYLKSGFLPHPVLVIIL